MMNDDPPMTDVWFGSDEQMLAWCEREGITPTKDKDGHWDWHSAWAEYLSRPENGTES